MCKLYMKREERRGEERKVKWTPSNQQGGISKGVLLPSLSHHAQMNYSEWPGVTKE